MRISETSKLDPGNKRASVLNDGLDKRMLGYMAAAGAAGVSVLAMAQPATAKVVYTPANRTIIFGSSYLDLNNDHMPEFGFHSYGIGNFGSDVVFPIKFNKMMSYGRPMAAGISVGPSGNFRGGRQQMLNFCSCSGNSGIGGPWLGVQNEYMGLEFNIKGAAHFGWARFSVTTTGGVTLTGYAYETVSLKAIVTGDEGGGNEESVSKPYPAGTLLEAQPATLGRLAQGTGGLAAWRREEEAIA